MKKIINGKRYDTDTAQKVGVYRNGFSTTDFKYILEDLYQKKTGEFFLHGQGGAMTKYAKACGQNSWTGGERILPMSYEEARTWSEEHLEVDEYESIFGEVEEDESRKTVTLSLSATVIEKLKREASKSGKTQSQIIEELVNNV